MKDVFRDNHRSAFDLDVAVNVVLKNQIAKKQAFYTSLDASRRKLGKRITVASLGAGRTGREVGVNINQAIKVRDLGAAQEPPDVKRAMKDKARAGSIIRVGCRHRRRPQSGASSRRGLATPVLKSGGGRIPLPQTVGTFGVGSAACYWERAAGTLSRLAQHVVSICAFFWLHVMADDLDVEASGPDFRRHSSLSSQLWRSWGFQSHGRRCAAAPWLNGLAMNSACGSVESEFRQAAWAVKWWKGLREAGIAKTAAVEEGVGRLSFIAWMLEYGRPFLSAMYWFLAVEERDVVRPLRFLEHSLTRRHHIDCASRPLPFRSALRVDAQAGEGTVGIGEWWPSD